MKDTKRLSPLVPTHRQRGLGQEAALQPAAQATKTGTLSSIREVGGVMGNDHRAAVLAPLPRLAAMRLEDGVRLDRVVAEESVRRF